MTLPPPKPAPDRAAALRGGNLSIGRGRSRAVKLCGKRRSGGKLSRRGGFSLAETLFCVLILAITSSTLISAITIATRQFNIRTRESEQAFLCGTLTLAVQDQLTYVNELSLGPLAEGTRPLTAFKSGAISGLQQRECRFAVVRYSEKDDTYSPVEQGSGGEIVLQYDGGYYQLTDHKNYVGRQVTVSKELEADIDVKFVGSGVNGYYHGYFDVIIRVLPRSGETVPVVNHFTVTPVSPNMREMT